MTTTTDITADGVRHYLLARAEAYAKRANRSFSFISHCAVNDSKFLANVQKGDNFTLRTYQRVIDWLDEQERAQ